MRKTIFFSCIGTLLLFSSCSTRPAVTATLGLPASPSASPTPASMPCLVVNPTPQASQLAGLITAGDHIRGPAEASVTILVYGDFQCPSCALLAASLKAILLLHPDDVRLVYRHLPLANHDKAILAIQAVEAADLQGKFWELHDLLYGKQDEWSALAPADFLAWVESQAAGLGLDTARFRSDFQGDTIKARTDQALQFAAGVQQPTVPLLFINSSTPYSGRVDIIGLEQVVRLSVLAPRQFSACPLWVIDPLKQYIATLHTAKGDMVLQLFADKAPLAVNNFVFLARHGWYDGITFYRVVPGSVAQTGDPSGTGLGNPGYLFSAEFDSTLRFDRPGMVAMLNAGPTATGSQFFITETAASQWDGQYAIFGQLLSGLDVLSALNARDPQMGSLPPPGDMLLSVTVEEK